MSRHRSLPTLEEYECFEQGVSYHVTARERELLCKRTDKSWRQRELAVDYNSKHYNESLRRKEKVEDYNKALAALNMK